MISASCGLITSQIDTAPKPRVLGGTRRLGLITSQIDTAPKRITPSTYAMACLITSQIDTAPKPLEQIPPLRRGRTT